MLADDTTVTPDSNTAPPARSSAQPAAPSWDDTPQVEPQREALVKEWIDKIIRAERYWKPVFDRMKKCRQLAREGAVKEWLDADSYTVPILPRHVNLMVSALYAKDPRVVATPRRKLTYKLWDGSAQTLKATLPLAALGDPSATAIVQEVESIKQYQLMMTRLGKTLELCWYYFTEEQRCAFKSQVKALVRRTKINGAGFIKLGYQRTLGKNPEIVAGIQDVTSKIAAIEAMLTEVAADAPGYQENSARLEELKLSLQDLQDQETIVVREGPIFDFPRSHEIVFDTKIRHLKSLAGAGWAAHRFEMTPQEILETYKINVGNSYTRYFSADRAPGAKSDAKALCRLWEVQDVRNQQTFVVCDGYPDFLREPATPDVKVERFWTIFPLVFNEVESDDGDPLSVYPPSDVWLARHPQAEYNRSRQGLREHRVANRPKYAYADGLLEEDDITKLTTSPAHAVIPIKGMEPSAKIGDKLQRIPMVGIDPGQYEVEESFKDVLRAVGSQEANIGTTSGDTATETSIAEQSRQSGLSDQIDELDDFLSLLAKSTGQLMLLELALPTVQEIAGPGAVWPEQPLSREDIAKDLLLDIKAGSSGRPNQAADLAKMERAAPYMLQLPGVNPEPMVHKYADLLDIPLDELYIEGFPSITALNAMAAKAGLGQPGGAGQGPGADPTQQGDQGGANAPSAQQNEPGAQPAMPAPGEAGLQVA